MEEEVLTGLNPDERIKHTLRAVAEENEEQVEKLIDTCPTHNYKATDLEYIHKKQILPYIGTLITSTIREAILNMVVAKEKMEETEKEPEEIDSDENIGEKEFFKAFDLHRETIISLKATLIGFEEFCQETLDIEPTTLLKATTSNGPRLFKEMENTYMDKDLDFIDSKEVEEQKKLIKEGLEHKWEFIEQETS